MGKIQRIDLFRIQTEDRRAGTRDTRSPQTWITSGKVMTETKPRVADDRDN